MSADYQQQSLQLQLEKVRFKTELGSLQDQVTDLTEQLHKTQDSGTEALNKLKEQHSKEQTDMEKKHKQYLQSLIGQNDGKEKLLKDFDEQKINISKGHAQEIQAIKAQHTTKRVSIKTNTKTTLFDMLLLLQN